MIDKIDWTEVPGGYHMTADFVRLGARITNNDGSELKVDRVEFEPMRKKDPDGRQIATVVAIVETSGDLLRKAGKLVGDEVRFSEGTLGRLHSWDSEPKLHTSEPNEPGGNMKFQGQDSILS